MREERLGACETRHEELAEGHIEHSEVCTHELDGVDLEIWGIVA